MKKYFIYLIVYSVGGFILERIINLIAYGSWYDNSVLIGPYQPLYGSGVVMAIIIYDFIISKKIDNNIIRSLVLLFTAILTTALSEAITGLGYEFLYGIVLWNYGEFFSCSFPYVCYIPTTLFGIGSYLAIVFLHPKIKKYTNLVPDYLAFIVLIIFSLDVIITFFFVK